MTLKNARRRFEEMGCEVERDVAPYRYKYRRLGAVAWHRGTCLDTMLAHAAGTRRHHDTDRMGN